MKIRNKTNDDRVIANLGGAAIEALAGEVIEVPDELGKSLLEQADNWEPVKGSKTKDEE